MEDFKTKSKADWLLHMRGLLDANVSKSGSYAVRRKEALEAEDKKMAEFCEYCLHELGTDLISNRALVERALVEDGYNIYALDEALGVPALISCTKEEYNETYDERGNIRQPSYIR